MSPSPTDQRRPQQERAGSNAAPSPAPNPAETAAAPAPSDAAAPGPQPPAAPPARVTPTIPQTTTAALAGRDLLALLAVVALLAPAWIKTFQEMWVRWYPAWYRLPDAPLMDRLGEGDSYYSHGPLVALTSLLLTFLIYRRVSAPAQRSPWASRLGWLALIGSLVLHLMSVYAQVMFVSGFALIGVLAGLTAIWGGWPLLRAYWLPIVVLFFMVPLPEVAIGHLNFRLKGVASDAAVWSVNTLFGIPAVKDGSYVFLAPGADGEPKMLVVENVCSGLRSLISLTFFAALFAMVCRVRGVWRLVMLAMAVPVAVLCNVVRITAMTLVAHFWTVAAAGEESWFHGFSGLMVFVLALALLFGLEQAIIWLARRLRRPWVDGRLLGYLDSLLQAPTHRLAPLRLVLVLVLAANLGLSLWWAREGPRHYRGAVAAQAVPRQVSIAGQLYSGTDYELDVQTLTILETDDYLYRRFNAFGMVWPVDLLIVFSPDNRKGTHPPEVCLEGGGERILSMTDQPVALTDGQSLRMRELLTQQQDRLWMHLYVYRSGSSYTTSFFVQQMTIFGNGMLARDAAGALIRLTCPVQRGEVEATRQWMKLAAGALMPLIDQGLARRPAAAND